MAAHRSYLRWLLAAGLSIGAMAATFNLLVDPYGLFGSRVWAGINAVKPASSERTRVVKPYLAERVGAITVIGGNSRPELGLDPDSKCWPASYQPVFNAGLPGAGVGLQTSLAMHASGATASRVLHGVDFLDFIRRKDKAPAARSGATAASADERRLFVPGLHPRSMDHSVQRVKDQLTALFSLTTMADAAYTIAAQANPNASNRTPAGFNPANDYRDIIRTEGQHVLFAQKERELANRLDDEFQLDPEDGTPGSSFTALRRLIDWSKNRNVELILFINPYHVEYLSILERSGQWPLFEQWKQTLLSIAETAGIPLWDFNTVDAYTTEQTHAPDDRSTALRWFWEPAHYRSALGEIMLARMLGTHCGDAADGLPFGARLSSGSIDEHLASLRRQVQYRRQHANSRLLPVGAAASGAAGRQ